MKFEKGESYTYEQIEDCVRDQAREDCEDYLDAITEFGPFTVGQNFLVVEDKKTYSFVLTGTMGEKSVFECIYVG